MVAALLLLRQPISFPSSCRTIYNASSITMPTTLLPIAAVVAFPTRCAANAARIPGARTPMTTRTRKVRRPSHKTLTTKTKRNGPSWDWNAFYCPWYVANNNSSKTKIKDATFCRPWHAIMLPNTRSSNNSWPKNDLHSSWRTPWRHHPHSKELVGWYNGKLEFTSFCPFYQGLARQGTTAAKRLVRSLMTHCHGWEMTANQKGPFVTRTNTDAVRESMGSCCCGVSQQQQQPQNGTKTLIRQVPCSPVVERYLCLFACLVGSKRTKDDHSKRLCAPIRERQYHIKQCFPFFYIQTRILEAGRLDRHRHGRQSQSSKVTLLDDSETTTNNNKSPKIYGTNSMLSISQVY